MFSPVSENDWAFDSSPIWAPPPPGVRADTTALKDPSPSRSVRTPVTTTAPAAGKLRTFDADLEVGEMDDRGRPSAAWSARGREVTRERMVFMSRRMVRAGALVLIAVHMIDDEPMPLFAKVLECDYESEGRHRVVVEFRPVPWSAEIRTWLAARVRR